MSKDPVSDLEMPLSSLSHGRVGAIVTVRVEDAEHRARITRMVDGKATLRLFERLSRPSESCLAVTLIQALPKKERMEMIVQKATELGVTAILPCISAKSITLSEREASQGKAHRWTAIAAKAVEQSRRRLIPHIGECVDLSAALRKASEGELKLILHEKEVGLSLHDIADKKKANTLTIAAGPEGGFTEDELLLAQSFGYVPVRLGGRILRCETASIAALSIAQFLWGDL